MPFNRLDLDFAPNMMSEIFFQIHSSVWLLLQSLTSKLVLAIPRLEDIACLFNELIQDKLSITLSPNSHHSTAFHVELVCSQVLFTILKRNDKREIKVAQLAGSVAEHSAYHHGEQSLMSTIINLAQNYVGSNNLNLLQPIGQFGTRLQGGKDAASPRYIFTMMRFVSYTLSS